MSEERHSDVFWRHGAFSSSSSLGWQSLYAVTQKLRDLKKNGLVMEDCLLGLESKQLYLDGEMHWSLSELKDVTLERLIFTGRAQSMCRALSGS